MRTSRRELLRKAGAAGSAAALASLAGCSLPKQEPEDDRDESDEVGSVSLPVPELTGTSIPNVSLLSFSDEEQDNGTGEVYTGVLSNTGDRGSVIVRLYWTEGDFSEKEDVEQEHLTYATEQEVEIGGGSEKTVTFTEEMPAEHNGSWMIVSPTTVNATVLNTGEAGDVDVTLYENETARETKTITLDNGEERTVEFTPEFTPDPVSFDIMVSVPEQEPSTSNNDSNTS